MLRGINVAGQKKVSMQVLRETFASLGYKNVQTYVQSGNVIFSTDAGVSSTKDRIEKEIKRTFGFNILVFLRERNEVTKLVKNSPFKQKDESKLHVTFLSEKPATIPLDEMNLAISGAEEFSISGREVYLFCPNRYGVTKLSNSFFEKKLKVAATTRNWRTVNTLLEMLNKG
jgi:uncharacterized protein (DUF1697 family)